jgi:hypothetical protein
MRYLERTCRAARIALFSLAVWLAVHAAALAQVPAKPDASGQTINSGVWVFAYFVVILGIVAGLLFVCRSGGRRDRARPELYGEAKVVIAEEEKK